MKKCSIDLSHFSTAEETGSPTKVRRFTLDILECSNFVIQSFSETARELEVGRSGNPHSRDSYFESLNSQEGENTALLLAGLQF